MTEFQLLSVPIGLVLGLGITKILASISNLIRDRKQIKLHWMPFIWAVSLILFPLVFFFHIWDLNLRFSKDSQSWTWMYYGPVMLHAIMMYLGCSLILPNQLSGTSSTNLLTDFDENGRLALVPLAITLIVSWPLNMYLYDTPFFSAANYLNVILAALILVAFLSNRRSLQYIATILFLLIQIYGMGFLWARPGHFQYTWE